MPLGRKLGVALLTLVMAWAAANAVFVWFPRTDSPARADVVVQIAGGTEEPRLDEGIRLVQEGYAPLLVTDDSGTRDTGCHTPVTTVCFTPSPNTTQGEARVIAAMAVENHWSNVLLVTSRDQATRARVRIRRCYHLGLRVVAVPIDHLVSETIYQDAAIVKAEALQRGC